MRMRLLVAVLLLQALPVAAAETAPDAWDRVLGAVGLTKQTAHFDSLDMGSYGGGDFVLPYFTAMHGDPLRIPFYSRMIRQSALSAMPSAGKLVMLGSDRIDEGVRRTLIGDPLERATKAAAAPHALVDAIGALHTAAGKPLSKRELGRLTDAAKVVPADVAPQASLLILLETRALQWRNQALRDVGDAALQQRMFDHLVGAGDEDDERGFDVETDRLQHRIDLKLLMVGGIDLALAVDQAAQALAKRTGTEQYAFDWDTPLGRIALHGGGNDTYTDRAYFLIVDSGGNDLYYQGGATYDAVHPVSVLLDLTGDDRYLERPELDASAVAAFAGRKKPGVHPTCGVGVLGYGIVLDAAGNDLYRGLSTTQGAGLFGIGALIDRGGNDRYDAYTQAQGSATFGVGVLADGAGADEYRCFSTSQGYGYVKGCGLLVDTGKENDVYDANDTVIDFPSPQDKNHNGTLAQGTGQGRRADYTDGHSLTGGIGILVDEGGKNSFTCGVYGQGAGYWYGVGLLSVGDGDDTYKGIWYVQGSVAHFAVGVLDDLGGNDEYIATHNMAQGAGHDFGIGFLIDEAGNDKHTAPNLSLGGGNANGFGFFWDKAGDDTYASSGTTMGRGSIDNGVVGSLRERNLTLGIFLDTGGKDTYPTSMPYAHDNATWTQAQVAPHAIAAVRGAGVDE